MWNSSPNSNLQLPPLIEQNLLAWCNASVYRKAHRKHFGVLGSKPWSKSIVWSTIFIYCTIFIIMVCVCVSVCVSTVLLQWTATKSMTMNLFLFLYYFIFNLRWSWNIWPGWSVGTPVRGLCTLCTPRGLATFSIADWLKWLFIEGFARSTSELPRLYLEQPAIFQWKELCVCRAVI